jgi:hypothetical protein
MKDKLTNIIKSRLQGVAIDKDYRCWLLEWLTDDMLEFGHYVAEEQKKQCLQNTEATYIWNGSKEDRRLANEWEDSEEFPEDCILSRDDCGIIDGYYKLILKHNSKNVCEQ